jgi:hypothetical protein
MASEFIEKQTLKLAAIYRETVALRFIANINAIVFGLMLFYLLIVGVTGMPVVVCFCMFIVNAVFYFSDYMSKEKTGKIQ